MANINVKKRLEKIAAEMREVAKHVSLYSGISSADTERVVESLKEISDAADAIAEEATKTDVVHPTRTKRGSLVGKKVATWVEKGKPEYDEGVVIAHNGDQVTVRWKYAAATYTDSANSVRVLD